MHRNDVLHNKPVDDNKEALYDSILADDNRDHGAAVLVADAEQVDAEPVAGESEVLWVMVAAWAVAVEADLAEAEGAAAVMVSPVEVADVGVAMKDDAVVVKVAVVVAAVMDGFAHS